MRFQVSAALQNEVKAKFETAILRSQEFSQRSLTKADIRYFHAQHRDSRFRRNLKFLERRSQKLLKHFADGQEVNPSLIKPRLEQVRTASWQSDLFRLATMAWSIPVSEGYGRRIRYLVWDESNQKLMGLIAIGDPVFNLRVRDQEIQWTAAEREKRLANVMDAYVLGALPPYNQLLVGKLVACLVRTKEVFDDFSEKYNKKVGTISGERKNSRLLAVTTSSSLGRSSVYNRLKLNGVRYFRRLGYTSGWGHFHVPDDLFERCRELLREVKHDYANGHSYDDGPNWKFRTIRETLKILGLREDFLFHGVAREVFISEYAANSLEILRGVRDDLDLSQLADVQSVSAQAVDRWILPRAFRDESFKNWTVDDLAILISAKTSETVQLC